MFGTPLLFSFIWRPRIIHFHKWLILEFIEKRILLKMDEEVRKRLEYEEQFFGMSSKFFSDCFKKLIQDELESKINVLIENLSGKLLPQAKNTEDFELALNKMKDDLTSVYNNALEKLFPEIESKISEFIHIPPNVLLKEDLPIKGGIGGDLNAIDEEIENLKGTFASLLYLKQKMLEELEEADCTIFFMEYIINKKKLDFNILSVEEISELSKANKYLISNDS